MLPSPTCLLHALPLLVYLNYLSHVDPIAWIIRVVILIYLFVHIPIQCYPITFPIRSYEAFCGPSRNPLLFLTLIPDQCSDWTYNHRHLNICPSHLPQLPLLSLSHRPKRSPDHPKKVHIFRRCCRHQNTWPIPLRCLLTSSLATLTISAICYLLTLMIVRPPDHPISSLLLSFRLTHLDRLSIRLLKLNVTFFGAFIMPTSSVLLKWYLAYVVCCGCVHPGFWGILCT